MCRRNSEISLNQDNNIPPNEAGDLWKNLYWCILPTFDTLHDRIDTYVSDLRAGFADK